MELQKSLHNDSYAVKIEAREGEEILGWAFLIIIKNDRHPEPYGLLENVYVEIPHRSKGIGKQLIDAILSEAKARGCYKILATSRHSKPEVHALYERYGFKNHGIEFRLDLLDSQTLQKD